MRWGFNRYAFGETQFVNMMLSVFVFSPVLLAFAGGWIGQRVHRSLQTATNDANTSAHAQPTVKRPHPLDVDYEQVKG